MSRSGAPADRASGAACSACVGRGMIRAGYAADLLLVRSEDGRPRTQKRRVHDLPAARRALRPMRSACTASGSTATRSPDANRLLPEVRCEPGELLTQIRRLTPRAAARRRRTIAA